MNNANQPELARQEALALTIPRSVTIVGCGGVGSWLGMFLALAGVPTLFLWDHDEVSETNLNRLPLGIPSLGMNKAAALAAHIDLLVARTSCYTFSAWTVEEQRKMDVVLTDDRSTEWIVACTDTWASRRSIWEWAESMQVKYIECSAEGEYGGCTGRPADFATPRRS